MTPRLKEIFNKEIQPALKDQFGFKNIYMAPRIEKVVLNMGLGLDATDSKILKSCEEDMAKITGQKPVTTKFKKSVANFKTRKEKKGGIFPKESFIHISNLKLIDEKWLRKKRLKNNDTKIKGNIQ